MILQEQPFFKRMQLLRLIEKIGPEKAAPFVVKQFLYCLRENGYPEEDYERVFGVEMVQAYTPPNVCDLWIGKLTYGAWQTLLNNKYITENDLINALWDQKLPQFFEQKVRQVYDEFIESNGQTDAEGYKMYMTQYVPELLQRGFNSIPWDLEVHQLLLKKIVSREGFPRGLVSGIKVEGDQIISEQIQMDSSFEKCPIAAAAGIPLFVKKLHVTGKKVGNGGRYIIVRMMSDPSTGIAPPRWVYGGSLEPAPPVLVARSDAITFTSEDWKVLDDFEMKMLDDGPRTVTRKDFVEFATKQSGNANVILEALFPKETRVRIVKLKNNIDLNGKTGKSTGEYGNGRVGIKVDDLDSAVAVKLGNLKIYNKK